MRAEIAMEYLFSRMCEMGFSSIEIHTRHVSVGRTGTRTIQGGSDLWVLCDEQNIFNLADPGFFQGTAVRIESANGVYDPLDEELEEIIHEHTGEINLSNRSQAVQYVMFLQATPKHKEDGSYRTN